MSNQTTLKGNAIDIQEPSTVDKHRECIAKTERLNEEGERKTCGNTPYLTAVTESGVRTPVCKMHAWRVWIDTYNNE